MAGVFVVLSAFLLCLPNFSDGINIVQSPPSLFESPGRSAELNCSHDDSSYKQIYWFHQTSKGALELIGYLNYKDVKPEEKFKERFSLIGDGSKADPSEGISIEQSPPVGERPGQSAVLECHHDDSNYEYMYWYQQSRGEGAFKLINPSEGISIVQSPPVGERPGQSAELECHHDASNYNYMYWYQQSRGEGAFKLIGYAYMTQPATYEDDFKTRFTFTKQTTQKGSLTISNLSKEDSAIYYCADSKAQCCRSPLSSTKTLHSHSLDSVENTSSHHLAFPV
ncbi:UNVERIFIED_CONTAM: hypothetical protein FKN15_059613 [Acipenser sinensis]